MSEEFRTRFAPAPTGSMHVGNLHTALFAWLTARHHGGEFVLRIEDTDELRSTDEALGVIYEALQWIGLDWDEGPDVGGPYGPYVQSQRLDIYQEYLQRLLAQDQAYECYCTPEELEQQRELMRARGLPPKYDGRCADLTEQERQQFRDQGREACIRFRSKQTGKTVIDDIIQGEVTYENALIGDPVIWKTSGFPTYHFAVVVDDCLMEISHVIRGSEHLPNTQVHIQLQQALGMQMPRYAHLPVVLGEDKTKLSKRHGAVSVTDYKKRGFLPEAMFNFLALLGWHPGDETEMIQRQGIIERFRLEDCTKAPAVFDVEKARWLNAEYITHADNDRLLQLLLPRLQSAGLFEDDPSHERLEWLREVIELMKSRAKLLSTFETWARYFFTDDYEYEERARQEWLGNAEIAPRLEALADRLQQVEQWDVQQIENAIRGLADDLGIKAAEVIHPCRAAVTGTTIGPSLFHLLEVIDQDDVINRLRRTAQMAADGQLQPCGGTEQ